MSTRISGLAVNAQAKVTADLLVGGFFDIMTGERPESIEDPVSETLRLSRSAFAVVPFAPIKDGVLRANALEKTVAIKTGEPTWCRCVTKDGLAVLDGTAGESDANAIVRVATIVQGQIVRIDGFTHTISKQGR